jgi:hypothetical protein
MAGSVRRDKMNVVVDSIRRIRGAMNGLKRTVNCTMAPLFPKKLCQFRKNPRHSRESGNDVGVRGNDVGVRGNDGVINRNDSAFA